MTDTEATSLFHKHLDACEQCREHPFNLCNFGARLMMDLDALMNADKVDVKKETR